MRILLFDMDGVLLRPRGYHVALMETVRMFGEALGFRKPDLGQGTINVFEAAGVTSEWESAAMCTALMLQRSWAVRPEQRLPEALPLPPAVPHNLALPDWGAFLDAFQRMPPGASNLERAERIIIAEGAFTPEQQGALKNILQGAHQIHTSLTHRVFQELVLGSRRFAGAYRLEAWFDRPGTLFTEDHPALTPQEADELREWIGHPDHQAAVFTNRPSAAPEGFFDTPEAEIGLQVIGFKDMPVIGHGGLTWLGARLGLEYGELLKPSPVHLLAALQSALSLGQKRALLAAADLALKGEGINEWYAFHGAQISVFEDAAKGVRGARNARNVLEDIGVHATWNLYGVSTSGPKIRALAEAGARVFPTLQGALADAGVLN